MSNNNGRRLRYEQVGAPTLLYRNVVAYSTHYEGANCNEGFGLWEARVRPSDREKRKALVRRRVAKEADQICHDYLQTENRTKMRECAGLPMQLCARYPYGSGTYLTAPPPPHFRHMGRFEGPSSRDARREMRLTAAVEHCSPFDANVVRWGLSGSAGENEDEKNANLEANLRCADRTRRKFYGLSEDAADDELVVPTADRSVKPCPRDYGNCLVLLPCLCRSCRSVVRSSSNELQSEHIKSWFIARPQGSLLTAVTVTRLILPNQKIFDQAKTDTSPDEQGLELGLELGETILQLSMCGTLEEDRCDRNADESRRYFLIARTSSRCAVISCSWVEVEQDRNEPGCAGLYCYEKIAEIGQTVLSPKYLPVSVASNPNSHGRTSYSRATFAIVAHSRSSQTPNEGTISITANPEQSVIHHVIVNGCSAPPTVEKREIIGIRHISQIEFTRYHPMVLWASARSRTTTKYGPSFGGKRPCGGRGMSLHSIDLRTCESSLAFSPSTAERMVEGLHSVSAILADCERMHSVYIQSISASKVWEVDGRMPGRYICSWALPGLCDDFSVAGRQGGIYGWGSILAQPAVSCFQNNRRPIFGLSKGFGTAHFGMYQTPEVYPRFATQSFECASSMGAGNDGFALSSAFSMPDVGSDVFNLGFVAFPTRISALLGERDTQALLGQHDRKETDQNNSVFCLLSMTNNGDLYGHSLLGLEMKSLRVGRTFHRLPVGCSTIPIPTNAVNDSNCLVESSNLNQQSIQWKLQNTFPSPAHAMLPLSSSSRHAARPFVGIDLALIPSNKDSRLSRSIVKKRSRNKINDKASGGRTAENDLRERSSNRVATGHASDRFVLPVCANQSELKLNEQYPSIVIGNDSKSLRGKTETQEYAGIDESIDNDCVSLDLTSLSLLKFRSHWSNGRARTGASSTSSKDGWV